MYSHTSFGLGIGGTPETAALLLGGATEIRLFVRTGADVVSMTAKEAGFRGGQSFPTPSQVTHHDRRRVTQPCVHLIAFDHLITEEALIGLQGVVIPMMCMSRYGGFPHIITRSGLYPDACSEYVLKCEKKSTPNPMKGLVAELNAARTTWYAVL